MLLKALEIHGFKSFADKTVLKFGRGITAVVGPNGSGKSNISDAVRWVLGEQSTKTLRGQKMEDVVFGGTAARRSLGYAEVTLTIDNTDRSLHFDSDSVAVTRRYYRSGESEYQINRTAVRLKDVHELFMDTGLGRDGYSMIGQGKIDSIVGTKSTDRRDIFEEAAGISRYRYRKLEAERRLAQAEENLLRLKDIMEELEGRVGPLKEQSEKAKQFLDLSDSKRELEIGLWLHTLSLSKDALREQEYKITLADTQYKNAEAELADMDAENEKLSEEMQRITVQIEETRRAATECEEAASRARSEIAVLENTIFHNGESIARITGEMESLRQTNEKVRDEISEKRSAAGEKEELLLALNLQLAEVNTELQGLLSDSETVSRQIEEQVRALNHLSSLGSEQRVKMVTAQSSLQEITARMETVDRLINDKKTESEKYAAEHDALQKDYSRLEERIEECTNTLKGYELRLASKVGHAEELKNQLDKLRLDIGEKRRRAQILEDLEKNMEGFAYSVKAVMKEAGRGMLRGVHGPFSRLIDVPPKYMAAVETALGASMQHIVVENEEDAKRAIHMLKSGNQGRATFLPITAIRGNILNEPELDGMDGFVGLAAHLVSCETQYQNILKSLLGRVAVAENIDCAVVIARKFGYRFKVVTLDGQVVNAGGSLTGGSLAKSAGLLSRAGEIERLHAEAETLEAEWKRVSDKHSAAAAELASVRADMAGVNGELITAGEDKIRVEGELRRVKGQRDDAARAIADLERERNTAAIRTEELERTVRAALVEIGKLDEEKTKVQSEIDRMSGGRDHAASFREELTEQATALKLQMIEVEKDKQALEAFAAELESGIGDRSRRTGQLGEEIAGLQQRNEELAQQIAGLSENIENLNLRSGESDAEVGRLNLRRNEIEKRRQELHALEREKTAERERFSGELARLEERKSAMLREYDEVIQRLYDEYELTRSEAEETGITVENPARAQRELNEIRGKIKQLGNVNVGAIEEYKEVNERYEFMSAQISDVEKSRQELYHLINQLTSQMREIFTGEFAKINSHFGKVFAELFGGGTAELRLTDPSNVLESGIDILVQPPGKKVSSIELLSGGEKALIAVSIYFAIMKVNPPPFCVMDEVETALDDINVDRFAEYMRRMSDSTQFICITHRRGTMEAADMLYGVTMQEKGVSKLLQLNVAELEKQLSIRVG